MHSLPAPLPLTCFFASLRPAACQVICLTPVNLEPKPRKRLLQPQSGVLEVMTRLPPPGSPLLLFSPLSDCFFSSLPLSRLPLPRQESIEMEDWNRRLAKANVSKQDLDRCSKDCVQNYPSELLFN